MLTPHQQALLRATLELSSFEGILDCADPLFAFNQILAQEENNERVNLARLIQLNVAQDVEFTRRLLYIDEHPEMRLRLHVHNERGSLPVTAQDVRQYIREQVEVQKSLLAPPPPPPQPQLQPLSPPQQPLPPPNAPPAVQNNNVDEVTQSLTRFLIHAFLHTTHAPSQRESMELDEQATQWIVSVLTQTHAYDVDTCLAALAAVPFYRNMDSNLRDCIRNLINHSCDRVRECACVAMRHVPINLVGEGEREVLYDRFRTDVYLTVKIAAAETLYFHGERDPELLDKVLECIAYPGIDKPSENPFGEALVRARAARALFIFNDVSPRVQAALECCASDDVFAHVRADANETMVRLGVGREQAMARLINLAHEENRYDLEHTQQVMASLAHDGMFDVSHQQQQEIKNLQIENERMRQEIMRLRVFH